ncbi:MAG: hypothetical protein PHR06_08150 [Candidatus Cloacimonetes bacterium]|nr:hypothetical protein [Candidatus Cloacimonadota bacterium]
MINKVSFNRTYRDGSVINPGLALSMGVTMGVSAGLLLESKEKVYLKNKCKYIIWDYWDNEVISCGELLTETAPSFDLNTYLENSTEVIQKTAPMKYSTWESSFLKMYNTIFDNSPFFSIKSNTQDRRN